MCIYFPLTFFLKALTFFFFKATARLFTIALLILNDILALGTWWLASLLKLEYLKKIKCHFKTVSVSPEYLTA